jgi:hypothetical protein
MRAIAEDAASESVAVGGESKMGLVRIAYEGPCQIDAQAGEDGVMHVRATIPTLGRDAID